MKQIKLNNRISQGFIATSLLFGLVIPALPGVANDLLRDIGIGAAANVVTGEIINNGSTVGNAVKGAATGAAVSTTHDDTNNSVGGTIQDAAIGAAANVVTGVIIDDGSVGENAATGAATGALLNILK